MILSTRHIYLLRLGKPLTMANGGDSDSDSSTNTTNQTDNYAASIDKRSVASDAAVSLTGNGNTVDRSTSTATSTSNSGNTSMVDGSNRSSTTITAMFDKSSRDNSTHFTDSSTKDNSTHFSDASVKDFSTHFSDSSTKDSSTNFSDSSSKATTGSYNTSYVSTDMGSVGAALSTLGMMSSKALDVAAGGVNGSIDAMKYLADKNAQTTAAAFDLAKSSGANALSNSAKVLGFAETALSATQSAMQTARDGGESKNVMYALAAVAVIGVAMALKS